MYRIPYHTATTPQAYWKAMKSAMSRMQSEMKKEQRDISKAHGNSVFGVDSDAAAVRPSSAPPP